MQIEGYLFCHMCEVHHEKSIQRIELVKESAAGTSPDGIHANLLMSYPCSRFNKTVIKLLHYSKVYLSKCKRKKSPHKSTYVMYKNRIVCSVWMQCINPLYVQGFEFSKQKLGLKGSITQITKHNFFIHLCGKNSSNINYQRYFPE